MFHNSQDVCRQTALKYGYTTVQERRHQKMANNVCIGCDSEKFHKSPKKKTTNKGT